MKKTHIIWFCGTGESIHAEPDSNPSHLFEEIKDYCSIVPGWGTENNFGNNMTYVRAQASGVKMVDLPFIDRCIESTLFHKKEKILNCENLVIGGFSRGSAFFVPYFLNKLEEFFSFTKRPKITLFLMDPVTGSSDDNDVTEHTLKNLKILTKEGLKDKVDSLIFISTGFDKRQKNFKLDKSFYDLKDHFKELLTAKIGLTHSALSVWSKQKGINKFVNSIDYGEYKYHKIFPNEIKTNKIILADFKNGLLNNFKSPDLNVTKKILNDLILQNGVLKKETLKIIEDYHDFTNQYLGESKSKNGVNYDSDFMWKGDNNLYKLESNSRLEIEFNNKL